MELAEQIIEYRARYKLSQVAFAQQLEMSPTTIRKIESGGKCKAVTAARIRQKMEERK